MEVFSFKNVLHMFYQSDYGKMMAKWRNNSVELGNFEDFSMSQVNHFLALIKEDKVVQEFLEHDRCYKLADKYLLSMVFVYFVRAKLPLSDYTRQNFFVALYLAHDIEEDDEDLKLCFVDWGLGVSRKKNIEYFISLRNKLWEAMDYRACVSLKTCHQVMESIEHCDLWKRERDPAHGGAVRDYEIKLEKCKRCDLKDGDKHFYSSDCDEFSGESSSEEGDGSDADDELSCPPSKRLRMNEE